MELTLWTNEITEDAFDALRKLYPDLSDDTLQSIALEIIDRDMDAIRKDFDKTIPNDIICFTNFELYGKSLKGIRNIGQNIKDIFSSDCEKVSWYVNETDVKCIETHRDGTNYLTYRVLKSNVNYDTICKVISSEDFDFVMKKYTAPLRPEIKKIYGWSDKKCKIKGVSV